MTKVLFDHQIFSLQIYGGISRYFANIQQALENKKDSSGRIGVLYSKNHYIQNYKAPLQNFLGKRLFPTQEKEYKWNKKYSKHLINGNNFDVLHPTYYEPYFLKKLKKPYIITVHDMIHELMPDYFPINDRAASQKREVIQSAHKIIAISETTKTDLKSILGIPDERIDVIYHGYTNKQTMNIVEGLGAPSLKKEYLLFVGTRGGYKNFNKLVNAIAPLLKNRADLKLICTGGGRFNEQEIGLFKKLEITKKIIQINASELQLNILYQEAMAFIFPSIYEGFGLPILEAFQNDCPVILSNSKCFQEIASSAAEYFDPNDENSILNVVTKVIDQHNLAQALVMAGKRRLQKFSPEACAEKTINLYKSIN